MPPLDCVDLTQQTLSATIKLCFFQRPSACHSLNLNLASLKGLASVKLDRSFHRRSIFADGASSPVQFSRHVAHMDKNTTFIAGGRWTKNRAQQKTYILHGSRSKKGVHVSGLQRIMYHHGIRLDRSFDSSILQLSIPLAVPIAIRLETIAILGWRPSLLGWRPSRVGWRPLLLETKKTESSRSITFDPCHSGPHRPTVPCPNALI